MTKFSKNFRRKKGLSSFFIVYSLLRASTGSFFDAMCAGTNPATKVKTTLITTNINALNGSNTANLPIPVKDSNIKPIGIVNNPATITPIKPAASPIIVVSALNTLDTSRFDAPILLNTPISFVRSMTEV